MTTMMAELVGWIECEFLQKRKEALEIGKPLWEAEEDAAAHARATLTTWTDRIYLKAMDNIRKGNDDA